MDPQTKLNPRNPKDAVAILNIATETLAGPHAGNRQFAVAVQASLETLADLLVELEAAKSQQASAEAN